MTGYPLNTVNFVEKNYEGIIIYQKKYKNKKQTKKTKKTPKTNQKTKCKQPSISSTLRLEINVT